MTFKQELRQRASQYVKNEEDPNVSIAMMMDFENGGEWSAFHIVDKAIKFLKESIDNYTYHNVDKGITTLSPDFEETFKNEMLFK